MIDVTEGQRFAFDVTVPATAIDAFAQLSGDENPLHMDSQFAKARGFPDRVSHGALLFAFVSRLVGMHCPGRDAIVHSMQLQFKQPVIVGSRLVVEGVVDQVSPATETLVLLITVKDAASETVYARGKVQAGVTHVAGSAT